MAEDDQTEEAEEKLDASYQPDVATLGGDDADFARSLGFGDDGDRDLPVSAEGAESAAAPAVDDPPESDVEATGDDPPDSTAAAADDDPSEADAVAADDDEDAALTAPEAPGDDDTAEPVEEVAAAADEADEAVGADEEADSAAQDDGLAAAEDDAGGEAEAKEDDDTGGIEYEEIRPRPAAEGIQETLLERADAVMARGESTPIDAAAVPAASGEASAGLADAQGELERMRNDLTDRDRALAAALADLDATHADLAAVRADLEAGGAVDEKELEEIRVELETTSIERDQLIDQLAATSGQLVQSQQRAEQLEASLKAARGALIPLPEGERALRAEVIGLRGRLDEAAQENVRLTGEVASVATELSIAAARVEDRQHEIDYHAERARDLEREIAEEREQLEAAIAQHREALGLATRLQADNNELRSTQAALEETLQARDLEITAREEHLRVTRDGLAARDTQLVDLGARLDQERHRIEALEADLERAAIERDVLVDKVARRESRIATLTSTLGRIEEAMGQRLPLATATQPSLAQAEWTRPSPTETTGAERDPRNEREGSESTPPASEPAGTGSPIAEPVADPTEPEPETLDPDPDPEESDITEELVEVYAEAASDDTSDVEDYAFGTGPDAASVESSGPAPTVIAPFPAILGRWRDRCFGEIEAAGGASVADFLAARLQSHLGDAGPDTVILRSLGGSLPDAESRLVTALHARGVDGLRMDVLDADEASAEARRRCIELAGLGEVVDVRVGGFAQWKVDEACHGVLLADALHAQPDAAAVLDRIAPLIERGALLLFTGRIASGPVQLSASTLMRLEELWQFLPEHLATHEGLGKPPFRGDDGGCPGEPVDAARVLCERFAPVALAGFGHLADLVVGPSRGFALSDDDADALQLLESVLAIDESRALTESLPPRHGVGVFGHASAGPTEVFGLGWPCLDPA